MAVLGTLVLVFIILHMSHFWAKVHFTDLSLDSNGNKDLHTIVIDLFQQWWYVLFYVASMFALGFHLWHGFQSAFQTLGLRHSKYTPIIKLKSYAFAILIPAGFAIIPVWIYIAGKL